MPLRVDSRLLEEAVFRRIAAYEAAGHTDEPRAYRRRIDAVYDTYTDGDRDRELVRLHAQLFSEMGFRSVLDDLIDDYPLIGERAELVSVECAERRKAEGAELFVRSDDGDGERPVRTVVLRVYPDSFLDLGALRALLRRELHHVSDMLDPAFGYERDLGTAGTTAARSNLVRDRYAVLWDVSIEARLARARWRQHLASEREGRLDAIPARLIAKAERVFAGLQREDLERRLLGAWAAHPATHALLLELARTVVSDAQGAGRPGDPCPLCGFSTHTWVERDDGPSCLQCSEMLDAYPETGAPAPQD